MVKGILVNEWEECESCPRLSHLLTCWPQTTHSLLTESRVMTKAFLLKLLRVSREKKKMTVFFQNVQCYTNIATIINLDKLFIRPWSKVIPAVSVDRYWFPGLNLKTCEIHPFECPPICLPRHPSAQRICFPVILFVLMRTLSNCSQSLSYF